MVNGDLAFVLRLDGEIDGGIAIRVEDARIAGLSYVRNPEKPTRAESESPLTLSWHAGGAMATWHQGDTRQAGRPSPSPTSARVRHGTPHVGALRHLATVRNGHCLPRLRRAVAPVERRPVHIVAAEPDHR
ncbi:hypothetical protein LRS74_33350 [Streptomyces sp. LX-29]|uniref:hypothetical protein n=1 Tax=Streptomyces sp. LX-29 TaxID=2900152 RepID=UPI00240D43E3|nr:hypothetical protein [Streptomyces sp. LX-29]WFB11371.1 hypothetical protein LRS74_33350 [Streptomyces sp. LX-29]